MSHELRTPMHAIVGFTRLVMRCSKNVLESRQYENLEKILEPVCKGPALDGRPLIGCATIKPMIHGCTTTGVERACDRDSHVPQRGREGGWSTSDPPSQHRKLNVGGPGRPSAATMDAPLLICQRLRVARRCKRPATPVGRSPMPCSWIWRWSTKSLGLRNISPEGPRCRMGQTSGYSGDVHVRPRLGAGERFTRLT